LKPKDIFGLIVRLVGLFFLYKATSLCADVLGMFITGSTQRGVTMSASVIFSVILNLLAAMWFFKGVPPYSGWAYPEVTADQDGR
jgi:hypothetical protein